MPFVVTPDTVTVAMLGLAGVQPLDHVVDLGSGDGRIVITAARRHGATATGVEIVPELVSRSRASAAAAGVADRVSFLQQDLFQTDLSRATVVTLYLLPEVNMQLRPRLLQLAPGTRVVSHDWDMGDWMPDRTLTLPVPDKPIGLEKSSRVHLWVVPARVQGLWCAAGAQLEISQHFQQFSAVWTRGAGTGLPLIFDGRVAGHALKTLGTLQPRMELRGEILLVDEGGYGGSSLQAAEARYRRSSAAGCPG